MAIRFVISDPNKLFRNTICWVLETSGLYECAGEVKDGNEVIDLVDLCAPDLLIFDLHMPELDGFSVMQHIRHRCPNLKILALTLDDFSEITEKALKFGADAVFSKSFGLATLQKSLERLMAGHGDPS